MTIIRTDLGDTRESARELRFEPSGSLTATNVQKAIEEVNAASGGAVESTNIEFADSPYTPLPSDTYLYVDSSGGAVTINMPAAADRNGVPLVIKDVAGFGSTNNITINPNGAETIDGLAALVINADFGGYRLNPIDGSGHTVSP